MTSNGASSTPAGTVDMNLEVVTLPVSDVDRAKDFYQRLGWRLDADIARGDAFRVIQFTPPHSACSIAFGVGVTTGEPGSLRRLILAVPDIDAARGDLAGALRRAGAAAALRERMGLPTVSDALVDEPLHPLDELGSG